MHIFQCCKMDEIRRNYETTVHITPQTLYNFKIHYFEDIHYYFILLHIIIQK